MFVATNSPPPPTIRHGESSTLHGESSTLHGESSTSTKRYFLNILSLICRFARTGTIGSPERELRVLRSHRPLSNPGRGETNNHNTKLSDPLFRRCLVTHDSYGIDEFNNVSHVYCKIVSPDLCRPRHGASTTLPGAFRKKGRYPIPGTLHGE